MFQLSSRSPAIPLTGVVNVDVSPGCVRHGGLSMVSRGLVTGDWSALDFIGHLRLMLNVVLRPTTTWK